MEPRKSRIQNRKLKRLRLTVFRLVQLLLVAAAATSPAFSKTIIIAHRGVANPFSDDDHGCSTKRLRHIRYPYIQGTRASLQAAWDAGADVVEVDLRVTKDRQVVVFHDEDVSCKTQGVGRVRDLVLGFDQVVTATGGVCDRKQETRGDESGRGEPRTR